MTAATTTHSPPKAGHWAWPPVSPNPPLMQELQFLPPSSSSSSSSAAPSSSAYSCPRPSRARPWTVDPSRLQKLMMGTATATSSCSSAGTRASTTRASLPDVGAYFDPGINKPLPCGWERCLDLKSGEVFIKKSEVVAQGMGSLRLQGGGAQQPSTELGRVPVQTVQEQRSGWSQKWMQGRKALPWQPLANGNGRPHPHGIARIQGEEEDPMSPDKKPLCLDLDLSLRSMNRSRIASEALGMSSSDSSVKVTTAAPASRGISRVHQSWKWQQHTTYSNEKPTSIQEMISQPTMATAVCSKCLMYVLLIKSNPTCPRCLNPIILDCVPQPSSFQKRARLEISPDDLSLSTDSSS